VIKEATQAALKSALEGFNAARVEAGQPPLNVSNTLMAESQKHALVMAADQRTFRYDHPHADLDAVGSYPSTSSTGKMGHSLAETSHLNSEATLTHFGVGIAFANGKAWVCFTFTR
jgi:hypothetical protein